jgi:hypothetical protein
VARKLVDEERGYRSIVLPYGLIQVLEDTSIFNPDDDNFDPVRAGEYAFGTSTNVERERRLAVAASLLFNPIRSAT